MVEDKKSKRKRYGRRVNVWNGAVDMLGDLILYLPISLSLSYSAFFFFFLQNTETQLSSSVHKPNPGNIFIPI